MTGARIAVKLFVGPRKEVEKTVLYRVMAMVREPSVNEEESVQIIWVGRTEKPGDPHVAPSSTAMDRDDTLDPKLRPLMVMIPLGEVSVGEIELTTTSLMISYPPVSTFVEVEVYDWREISYAPTAMAGTTAVTKEPVGDASMGRSKTAPKTTRRLLRSGINPKLPFKVIFVPGLPPPTANDVRMLLRQFQVAAGAAEETVAKREMTTFAIALRGRAPFVEQVIEFDDTPAGMKVQGRPPTDTARPESPKLDPEITICEPGKPPPGTTCETLNGPGRTS